MTTKINAEDFEAQFETTKRERSALAFDEVHTLEVESVHFGEGEYGEWVSLTTPEHLHFFASYEMEAIVRAIGEAEAPMTLQILRRKVEGKNGRTYNKAFVKMADSDGGAE